MSLPSAIEGKMLGSLRAPDRFERTAETYESLTDIYRAALLDTFKLARQAWQVAQQMAVSHRKCHVGSAARLVSGDFSHRKLIDVFGYNFKPDGGATPNIHAEEIILYQAQVLGATTLNLVVVGEPQPDNSISGHDLVLAPCDYRCTPQIVTNSSVGNFTMATCVNPLTGATQFIPHPNLATRDWSEIPCIEVDGLNDHGEWLKKAMPIIDQLIQQTDMVQLELFIARKERERMDKILDLFLRFRNADNQEPHFLAAPTASTVEKSTFAAPPEITGQPASFRHILLGNVVSNSGEYASAQF